MKQTTKTRKKKTNKYPPEQMYKKVNGKYIPVPQFPNEPAEGLWLIQKHERSTSYRQMVSKLSDLPSDLTDLTKLEIRRDELAKLLLNILDGYMVMSVNDMINEIFFTLSSKNEVQIDTDKPSVSKVNKNKVPVELMWRLVGKIVEFEYCVPSMEVNQKFGKLNRAKLREKKTGMVTYHDGTLKRITVHDGKHHYYQKDIDLKSVRVLPPEEEIVWKLEHEGGKVVV